PPPNVPPLNERKAGEEPTSVRERLEQHRRNPTCASCHSRMDPLGFALENFDAVGHWRSDDHAARIDPSGVLPDGTKFNGPSSFRTALLSHQDEFVSTLIEKLLTYAVGRGLEFYDLPAVRTIKRAAAAHGYRWSSIVLGVVNSVPFRMKERAES